MSGSKQRKVEDLSREELETVVQEVYMTLYDEPDKDWGADELAAIDEALTRKNLTPSGLTFELTDVIFVKREVALPDRCPNCGYDLRQKGMVVRIVDDRWVKGAECFNCREVFVRNTEVDLPAKVNTRLQQAVQDLVAVEEEEDT